MEIVALPTVWYAELVAAVIIGVAVLFEQKAYKVPIESTVVLEPCSSADIDVLLAALAVESMEVT